ncbi:hypothetical protein DFJ58DRAFT_917910 [Suillus subalutaceus]|uniref:uncharacterized protein n=1 Tax=Suillus subalutaceus TaxID=48586 RepID=UPI001B869730|nr:uncharacterized protein DFJ58DRAFT_917910 [Suillus subalutaceus]KAG1835404.1 hypothetical protein DFJ58DRAFT_917910 [Suillus subalutaceus]
MKTRPSTSPQLPDVSINDTVVSASRLFTCPLDLEALKYNPWSLRGGECACRYLISKRACRDVELHTTTPSRYPAVAIAIRTWSALSLRELISVLSLTLLPQFLLARPDPWQVQHRIVESLLDHLNLGLTVTGESQRKWESFVFEDANDDDSHSHFPSFPPEDGTTNHPILELILPNSLSSPKVKHVLVPSKPSTSEDERIYTPQFSPSAFFRAVDEFRSGTEDINSWRIGEALIYGEVVSSTQTMFDKCVSPNHVHQTHLSSVHSPLPSSPSPQYNWQDAAEAVTRSSHLQVACKIRVGSQGLHQYQAPSNLIFIQYLYALAIIDACHVLNPASEWAHKVRLIWPNYYGLFPSSQSSPTSNSKSTPELRKMGGILVNTSLVMAWQI